MRGVKLKCPRHGDTAKQCREMGIDVGNIIVGRESWADGGWSEARLTLLFLGKSVAVWSVKKRNNTNPRWRSDGECGNWTLRYRQWELVG